MLSLINYNSGELEISDDAGNSVRLSHQEANRLVMAARMHAVEPFIEKLPQLIPNDTLVQLIMQLIQTAQGSERWNLKERFARLNTVTPGITVVNPNEVSETVEL